MKKPAAASDSEEELLTREDQLELQALGLIPTGESFEVEEDNQDKDSPAAKPKKQFRNNKDALMQKYQEMRLDNIANRKLPWIETLDIVSDKPLQLEDVHNDLARELAFYQQALHAAKEARSRIIQAGVAFDRPSDYFAEMVKSDEHMEKIRQRLVEEAQAMKKSEEAKKMRDMKKFGKQVQVRKLQERARAKSDTLNKIQDLKRKRKNNPGEGLDDEDFDIALDDTKKQDSSKKQRAAGKPTNAKRQKKDEKFGFGGKKRHAKSNTVESTQDFKFDNKKNKMLPKGMRGAKKQRASRPGKTKRKQARGKF